MTTAKPITVFVCGPTLSGEVLTGLTVRDGAVIWEGGADPAPTPVEPIRATHIVPGTEGLTVVVTDEALYLTTVDDLTRQPSLY